MIRLPREAGGDGAQPARDSIDCAIIRIERNIEMHGGSVADTKQAAKAPRGYDTEFDRPGAIDALYMQPP